MIERRRLFGLGLAATLAVGGLAGLPTGAISAARAEDEGEGQFGGQVADDDGTPLAGAIVTVTSAALDTGDATLTSDGAGRFALGPVPAGLYDVMAELEGYRSGSLTTLRVRPGQAAHAAIVRQRRAPGEGGY